MKRRALILLAALAAACESSPNSPRELLAIVESRARWQAQGIVDYNFDFTGGCGECDPNPQRIEVRNGAVVRAISKVTGDTTGPAPWIPNVDSLYEWVLRDRTAEHCGRQRIQIDGERFYPRHMSCSGVTQIADSGHWWSVSGFQPVVVVKLLSEQ
jgi:hypothetical protein